MHTCASSTSCPRTPMPKKEEEPKEREEVLHPQYSQFGKLCPPQITCITTTKGSGSECILCVYGTDK
ncbi:hypothetical protein BAE44_0006822 [Dichanthelium oligosanthes]|uniref:Uncharacterized protein n=1 Tax=Dichanthelium oligosanthes TaxID=888268 RepID=A0A1E5W495_9POAL|nr:hypothetical protein BAE44_0006822 [Dichanthelium oligosanthes]